MNRLQYLLTGKVQRDPSGGSLGRRCDRCADISRRDAARRGSR